MNDLNFSDPVFAQAEDDPRCAFCWNWWTRWCYQSHPPRVIHQGWLCNVGQSSAGDHQHLYVYPTECFFVCLRLLYCIDPLIVLTLCEFVGDMKRMSKVLQELSRMGKWKWMLHYRDSRRLKEDARLVSFLQKNNLSRNTFLLEHHSSYAIIGHVQVNVKN